MTKKHELLRAVLADSEPADVPAVEEMLSVFLKEAYNGGPRYARAAFELAEAVPGLLVLLEQEKAKSEPPF